ncbi:FAD-dependent oxidoreductase [Hymenobacter rubripertinctus]|uniref:FAD-dependent oxidoreductase n=1 Tax=Hymenobacter rubripertinctus TaxID=2029981 RepID=A0A418R4W5_9BACT|nr:FAD-dependent oxidoreductase [Hymenobacter rubripertinctus]RIY12446.1 FAD-dependent oxidoreductase [Hymenobacter rubripertinctus]
MAPTVDPARTSGATVSSWFATAATPPTFAPLRENTTADVVVVGGGIAGLTTAYLLGQAGKKVVLLEDGELASGESGRTTAHLSNALDEGYTVLEELFGAEGAQLAAESHTAAIAQIEQIVGVEHISCDFARLDGYLFLPKDGNPQELHDELAAAHRAGLTGVEWLSDSGTKGFATGQCLRFPQQGQFHIIKYLNGLAAAITAQGGRIFTRSHVTEVSGGSPASVRTTEGFTVEAQAVVVATNSPFNDRVVMHTKQSPWRTYALAARVPKGAIATALYWDTPDPYHYIRIQPVESDEHGQPADYDLLLVGGEDHKVGEDDPQARLDCLEDWARTHFPQITAIDYRWSGQVLEPNDSLAYAGRNPLDSDNVYIITGDSGHGMTHGTLGAMLLRDLILGHPNPWESLYDPGRVTLKAESLKEYAKDNASVVADFTELLTGGDVASADDIAPGSGAVLRQGLTKVAVYKDPQGQTHTCSAICPHLGCVVHWNDLETSWDCPCHGSRFDAYGHLLAGPANSDLAPKSLSE